MLLPHDVRRRLFATAPFRGTYELAQAFETRGLAGPETSSPGKLKDQGHYDTTPIAKLGRSISRTHCDEYMFPKYEIHYFCNLGIVFLCFWTHREPFRSKYCEFSYQL